MPYKPPTYSELLRRRTSRRERDAEYEARRRNNPALVRANRIRSSSQWKKVRAIKLAADPLCEDCREHGVTRPAAQVHHLQPVASRPDLAFHLDNLRSLCTTCHAKREAQERRRS